MLKEGLMKAAALAGQKFADPRSWHDTVEASPAWPPPSTRPSSACPASYRRLPGQRGGHELPVDDHVRRHVVLVRPLADTRRSVIVRSSTRR